MNSFIVMQGETYQDDKRSGIIWCPQKDKSGMVPHSYKRMEQVKKGDRIFHFAKGHIAAISVAKEHCRKQGEDTYVVPVDYRELEIPFFVKDHMMDLDLVQPVKYAAFQMDGSGNPGYIYPCNEELTIGLLEFIGMQNIYMPEEEQLELAIEVVKRTDHNPLATLIAETELEARLKVRRGRQLFRKSLLPLWDRQCAMCGIGLEEVLQAAYSKPWKDSSDSERLDPYNGLLLCSNHAALYAKGFISVDGKGRLLISAGIPEEQFQDFSLSSGQKLLVYPENAHYFKWHKKNIFQSKLKNKQ